MNHPYKQMYIEKVVPSLSEKFGYKNPHQIPKIIKIKVNRGLGLAAQNKTILQKSVEEVRLITGQQPIITRAKKSIAGFKIREEMELGVTVTLRREKMYSFLERLINLVLPRVRDFRGLDDKAFDKFGNYNFGILEQLVFPEISYNIIDQSRGYNITIVTTAKTSAEGYELLSEFGFPFKKSV
uniref:50S ribosomal protein L5, chloroplastic n=1 Tax=Eustigmatophyceae sp. Bat 8/9-7w TaxID=2506144 RepID=A0A3R5QL42_9STRA|nr:ribosomal protein L5 [Eustigmatophyceae sp. Bat 8/9-7w]QAA11387.1 ribosomal protein L5 [Eustigmatophyceae sp. Bat 8/9-7w]